MITITLGLLLAIIAGYARGTYSLMDWYPFQTKNWQLKFADWFPILGIWNNSFPLTMDCWHFHQWLLRVCLSVSMLLVSYQCNLWIGWTGFLIGVTVPLMVEGNSFKVFYHNLLVANPPYAPYFPLKKLLIPYAKLSV